MMEQDRKEKAPEPAEVWALAVLEKERGAVKEAVKDAAGRKAVVVARGKAEVTAKHRGGAVEGIRRLLLEKGFTMSGGNGTGPMGTGPMTGRAAGICAGNTVPGSVSAPGGRGFRRGGGGRSRRGRRNRFYATGLTGWQRAEAGMPAFGSGEVVSAAQANSGAPSAVSKEQELDLLKRQADGLANTLDEIKKRVAGLETQPQEG